MKNLKNVPKLVYILSCVIIFLVPGLLAVFMKFEVFSNASGGTDGWLSYWGAYLGGIIGLIAVVVTTQFILANQEKQHKELIQEQRDATEQAAALNDQKERDRIYTTFLLNKNEEIYSLLIYTDKLFTEYSHVIRDLAIQKEKITELKVDELISRVSSSSKNKYEEQLQKAVDEYRKLRNPEKNIRIEIEEKFSNLKAKGIYLENLVAPLEMLEYVIDDGIRNLIVEFQTTNFTKKEVDNLMNDIHSDYKQKYDNLVEVIKNNALLQIDILRRTPKK